MSVCPEFVLGRKKAKKGKRVERGALRMRARRGEARAEGGVASRQRGVAP